MERQHPFSSKAEYYARYRWDYAPQAIDLIFTKVGITSKTVVADVGAGTGILTHHFVGKAGRIYAIEPEVKMRQFAEVLLEKYPSFISIDATAEATGLPDESVDLIVVGQAIHWFDPETTRSEFLRILKPGAYLVILWNEDDTPGLKEGLSAVCITQNGWQPAKIRQKNVPIDFYYLNHNYECYRFSQTFAETWDVFIGALVSNSHAPDPGHPLYDRFENAAREVFERLSKEGILEIRYHTELCLGIMNNSLPSPSGAKDL